MNSRPLSPTLENDLIRDPSLGFEPQDACGFIRCIEHGFPTPLARWHYHNEYELQLIVDTRGRAFIGNYIGDFEPGHLVLTGPRLPHNWISTSEPVAGSAVNRLVIQFQDEPLRRGMELFHELADLSPLLERACHGVEFFGMSEITRKHFYRIRQLTGSRRFSEFVNLLADLAACKDFKLLSTERVQCHDDDPSMERLNRVLDYVSENFSRPIEMNKVYAIAGMSQSTFYRTFSRATGSTFTDFLNRYRISKACELLLNTDRYISNIAFEVGFNNMANFHRRFIEVKGMKPSEFRRDGALRYGAEAGLTARIA